MGVIRVVVLGELTLHHPESGLIKFQSKLERQLLAYLSVYPERHDRDDLAAVFWGIEGRLAARKNLSQLLWRISKSLNADIFAADRDSVQLDSSVLVTDLAQVRRALEGMTEPFDTQLASTILRAAPLELLKGFTDDWVFEARDRWQIELNAGLRKLEHLAEMSGAFEAVIELAQAQIRLEPLNERANASLIRTLLVMGRHSEARDHFEHFKRSLADIGEVVGGKMRVLAERIQSGHSMSGVSNKATLEIGPDLGLIGRTSERERCLKALAEGKLGSGRIVLIEGEPGIGKSKLMQNLADDATWRGQNVLKATAQEWRQLEPYLMVQTMLNDNLGSMRLEMLRHGLAKVWAQEASALIPRLASNTGARIMLEDRQNQQRLRESLIEVLKALAKIQPLAIFIDDLQWADAASLELLTTLSRTLEGQAIGLVIGFRTHEARANPQVWGCVEAHAITTRIQLQSLSKDKIVQLAQKALGIQLLPEVANLFQRVSQGNPLLMLETLKAMLESGVAFQDQRQWLTSLQSLPLPRGFHEIVVSRLSHLGSLALEVVQLSAAVGANFEFELLQDLTQIPSLELLDILDALIGAGFLKEIEPGFGFAHDRLRQTVYAQLPESERVQLHARILETLQTRASSASEVLATHAARSNQMRLANRYRLEAGECSLELHGYLQATSFLDAIGDLGQTDFDAPEQIRFLEVRTRVDAVQNNTERLLSDLIRLERLPITSPSKRIELLCRRAKTLGLIGKSSEALALIADTAALTRDAEAIDQTRVLIAQGSILVASGGPYDAALPPLERAVQLCTQFNLPLEAEARGNLGLALTFLGRFEAALFELQTAVELTKASNDILKQANLYGKIASLHMFHSYFSQAIPFLETALELCEAIGLSEEKALNLANLGLVSFQLGHLERGFAYYDRALEVSVTLGARSLEAHVLGVTAIYKYLHQDPKAVVRQLEGALQIQTELNARSRQCFLILELGLVHFWSQDYVKSQDQLERAVLLSQEIKDLHSEMNATIWLVEIQLQGNQFEPAFEMATHGLQSCLEHQFPNEQLQFKRLLATLEFRRGNFQVALEQIRAILPESGRYLGVKIYGFYAFHLLHFKILSATNRHSQALSALECARTDLEIEFQNFPSSQRAGLRRAIPVLNEILLLCEHHLERRNTVRLAANDAPIGRALQPHEYLEVVWTVHLPTDDQISDKAKRRQHQLERLCSEALKRGASPTLEDLASALNSSVATVKRDLAALRAVGVQLNTRGARNANPQNGAALSQI
jgi:DNA-binding SARP family transcriptional activator